MDRRTFDDIHADLMAHQHFLEVVRRRDEVRMRLAEGLRDLWHTAEMAIDMGCVDTMAAVKVDFEAAMRDVFGRHQAA